jgi:rhamnogalacturonyl hydrolase YesR
MQGLRKLHNTAILLVGASLLCLVSSAMGEPKEFRNWPSGTSPKEVGTRVAERFLAQPKEFYRKLPQHPYIIYPETVAWYGALTFSKVAGEKDINQRLIKRFDTLMAEEPNMVPKPVHVDNTVFAAVPFEVYIQLKEQKALEVGKSLADAQWANPTPEGLPKGMTDQTRFWIDDMYMITMAQVQAYRATGDKKYIDRAALEMAEYLKKVQQPNGLFFHAPDVPFYWSRGNGWFAAGMSELLLSLPKNHPLRPEIMAGYRKMMKSLLQYQGKDGMWRQLIDHDDFWPESSGTGMFTFAMVTGVKNGWLKDKPYAQTARKGWLALVSYINENGDVKNVCEGTNKKNDLEYYRERKQLTGDPHGQAPILWAATAFLR